MAEQLLNDRLTLEMHLDMLVDGELPEPQRRDLLLAIEKQPEHWRQVALRFLSRQGERAAVRQLISAIEQTPETYSFAQAAEARQSVRRGHRVALRSLAAGLMIALVSAGLTVFIMNGSNVGPTGGGSETITARMPGEALGLETDEVKLEVPIVRSSVESTGGSLFMNAAVDENGRRSLVIQPDGHDQAVIIPVNTLPNVRIY